VDVDRNSGEFRYEKRLTALGATDLSVPSRRRLEERSGEEILRVLTSVVHLPRTSPQIKAEVVTRGDRFAAARLWPKAEEHGQVRAPGELADRS